MRAVDTVLARIVRPMADVRDRALSADSRSAVSARLAISVLTRVLVRVALTAAAVFESAGGWGRRRPSRHTVEVRHAHVLGFGEWAEGSAIADRLGTDTFSLFVTGATVEIAAWNGNEWIVDDRGPVFRIEPAVQSTGREPRRSLRVLDGYDVRLLMKRNTPSDPSTWG